MPSPEKLLERLEDMRKLVEELRDLSENTPIIVEGRRDALALKKLGVTKNVLPLNTGIPLTQFCEEIARKTEEAVILTDLDRKGGKLARTLKDGLSACGVRVNERIRAQIALISVKEVSDIESLPSYLERLRAKSPEKDR